MASASARAPGELARRGVSRREAPERYRHDHEQLGASLRALREAAGLTGMQAAQQARMSQPKISKIENAVLLPSVNDVETLLDLYRAEPEQGEGLLDSRARSTRRTSPRGRSSAAAPRASSGRSPRSRPRRRTSERSNSRSSPACSRLRSTCAASSAGWIPPRRRGWWPPGRSASAGCTTPRSSSPLS